MADNIKKHLERVERIRKARRLEEEKQKQRKTMQKTARRSGRTACRKNTRTIFSTKTKSTSNTGN